MGVAFLVAALVFLMVKPANDFDTAGSVFFLVFIVGAVVSFIVG